MCPTYDDLQMLGVAMLIGMFCSYKLGRLNGVKYSVKKLEKMMPKISNIVIQQQTDIIKLEELMNLKDRTMWQIFFTNSKN